jgi:hypothetical protein
MSRVFRNDVTAHMEDLIQLHQHTVKRKIVIQTQPVSTFLYVRLYFLTLSLQFGFLIYSCFAPETCGV